jgi:hypothetical protein
MFLVENKIYEHVSSDTTIEFEEVIISKSLVTEAKLISPVSYKIIYFLYRLAKKIGFSIISKTKSSYLKNPLKDKKHLFTVMMGLDEGKFKPYAFSTNHCRSIYLFDAWPCDFEKITNFANRYKIDFLFITASDSVKLLGPNLKNTIISWIPEGINPTEYKQNTQIIDKTIDVLALGRKYDLYHDLIVDSLAKKGYTYLYELKKGELIFPTRQDFIEGLAKTKISICVPSSVTHPERSGDIETMTIRYLQSMVSKCLIVGHAPKEMIDLFGYNPVIEINMSDPVGQIEAILRDFDTYIPLIEKNYQQVLQHHTWSNRWNQIKNIWSNQSK